MRTAISEALIIMIFMYGLSAVWSDGYGIKFHIMRVGYSTHH